MRPLSAHAAAVGGPYALAASPAALRFQFGNVFSSAAFPNQGLVDGLHGADVSGLVSVGVAAAAYLVLRRTVRPA